MNLYKGIKENIIEIIIWCIDDYQLYVLRLIYTIFYVTSKAPAVKCHTYLLHQ